MKDGLSEVIVLMMSMFLPICQIDMNFYITPKDFIVANFYLGLLKIRPFTGIPSARIKDF